MKTFYTALMTYFNAMTGSAHNAFYIDVAGQLYHTEAEQGATFPYCVLSHVLSVPEDTFTEKLDEILIQFSIFSKKDSSVEVMDAMADLKTLFDDCSFTITGDTLVYFVRGIEGLTREEMDSDEGQSVWHYHVDYRVLVQR